ncbi:branched-chain amino acid ABC transporter substrate-binding protein [Azomonas macrocytogenes]|uniref:Branched-chain amino acid transport system substrate-binding protein n=1 Tax=Azomonas macrocytogenes TaxID=69962 RepID=A0A839SY70_AZOMA|nr:branched-chain amino acid ABC transporter substrate-binding protein [Azomonas macrocytogenes]MBB3102297.1 branched-chain amino acid transport system substrate-binding protein [Azomonas macrocytogenes]
MKNKKHLSRLFVALALSGATSFSLAADTIKIAFAGPATGPLTQYGDMQFNGSKMAVEQINKAGGVDGKQLEGIVYDDACDPKQAVAVANKVVNNEIKFVIGHFCSSATQPAADVYNDEGILMITPSSTNPAITERGYKLVFRTIGLDSDQGPTAANFIADHVKPKNVAIIHDKQQYGEGLATAVKQTLEKRGVKVGMFTAINPGDKDFSSLIAQLKKENPDIVYFGGYHPELGLLLRQSRERGLNVQFMGPEGTGNTALSAIAGAASEGLYVTLPPPYDQDPRNKTLADAFKAANRDPSGPFVFTAYAAVQALAQAIGKVGEDPEEVAEYLHQNSFDTPIGKLAFDAKGDPKDFKFVVYTWHQDGSKTEIK